MRAETAGEHTEALPWALGMTEGRTAAQRRDGGSPTAPSGGRVTNPGREPRAVEPMGGRDGPSGQRRLPRSERRSRRSGAKSETRALLLRRLWAASREVSSRISRVASAASRCGTAGPPSTARWRSRRELVAPLPHVMAGTRGLLRIAICSMSLPTRTKAPGPGQVNPIAPRRHSCIPVAGLRTHIRRLTPHARILSISGRVGQNGNGRRRSGGTPVTRLTGLGARRTETPANRGPLPVGRPDGPGECAGGVRPPSRRRAGSRPTVRRRWGGRTRRCRAS